MHTFIKLLYSILVAGAITAFTILTIMTFYQAPKYPDYQPQRYTPYNSECSNLDNGNCDTLQNNYTNAYDTYQKKYNDYQKNVSYIEIPVAILATIAGAALFRRSGVLGEGLALGGIFLSIAAVIYSNEADARIPRFIAALVMILIVMTIAYVRFSTKKITMPSFWKTPSQPQPPAQPAV